MEMFINAVVCTYTQHTLNLSLSETNLITTEATTTPPASSREGNDNVYSDSCIWLYNPHKIIMQYFVNKVNYTVWTSVAPMVMLTII